MANDLTPSDLSHLSEAEFQALCPQGEHAPGPEPLSAAAQAVLDATFDHWPGGHNHPNKRVCLAAALRAAADQVVPEHETTPGGSKIWPSEPVLSIRAELLTIAAELDAQ